MDGHTKRVHTWTHDAPGCAKTGMLLGNYNCRAETVMPATDYRGKLGKNWRFKEAFQVVLQSLALVRSQYLDKCLIEPKCSESQQSADLIWLLERFGFDGHVNLLLSCLNQTDRMLVFWHLLHALFPQIKLLLTFIERKKKKNPILSGLSFLL